jgi:hypothetical protein
MSEPMKNDQAPFAFWLVERFLPHDEEPDAHVPMSDFQFCLSLGLATAVIAIIGIVFRRCTIW